VSDYYEVIHGRVVGGTTQYAQPHSKRWYYSRGNYCRECGCEINIRAKRCRKCNGRLKRTIKASRERFARRAQQLTRADILALTAAQMDWVCDELGVEEARCTPS